MLARTASARRSSRRPETSLIRCAPASSAAAATSGFQVSTETVTPGGQSGSTTATTRAISSAASVTGVWVTPDSPPTSMRSAPAATSASPCSTCAAAPRRPTASENESGLALTIPMSSGRPGLRLQPPVRGRGAAGSPRVVQEQVVVGPVHVAQAQSGGGSSAAPVSEVGPSPATSSGASVSSRSSTRSSASSARSTPGPPSQATDRTPRAACRCSSAARRPPSCDVELGLDRAAGISTVLLGVELLRARRARRTPARPRGTRPRRLRVATTGWAGRPAASRAARWSASSRFAYFSAASVPVPARTQSAAARRPRSSARSSGCPSLPERSSTVARPSIEATMTPTTRGQAGPPAPLEPERRDGRLGGDAPRVPRAALASRRG